MKRTTHFNKVEANDFSVNGKTIVPIAADVEYTVAADGDPAGVNDFDSWEDAMVYMSTLTNASDTAVTLTLNDGLHFSLTNYYTFTGINLTVNSASSNQSLCTLTSNSASSASQFFSVDRYSYLSVSDITLDPVAGGDTETGFGTGVTGSTGSTVLLKNVLIKNIKGNQYSRGINCISNTYISLINVVLENCSMGLGLYISSTADSVGTGYTNIDACTTGIDCSSSYFDAVNHSGTANLSITNCTTGIASKASIMRLNGGAAPVFSGNTTDVNVPLNEIDYDGKYVSDGSAALSFKA